MTDQASHTRIKLIFIGAICFLIALSVLSYVRVNDLIEESLLVDHTNKVKLTLAGIAKALFNAETNQKSYLLTGHTSVLSQRDEALHSLHTDLNKLDTLIRDNPQQASNLKVLQSRIDLKLQSMKDVMGLYSPIPSTEFKHKVTEGIGFSKAILDQINQMQAEEDRLLKERSASFAKAAAVTPLLTILLTLGATIILVASYLKILKELRISDTLKSGILKASLDLSVTNETLKNKTTQLEEAQQMAHIGSWEWDVKANRIEWSDELYRIYGLTPQEFEATYENYLKYIHPDDQEYANKVVQQAFNDHQPFSFFHKLVRPDGSVRVLGSTGKVITDGNANIIRMAGTAQDITWQKKYEQDLSESEERFLKIFDNNPIPMTLSEIKTNKIQYANKPFYAAFGYSEEEVIGHTSEELQLMSPEENVRLVGLIMKSLQDSRSLEELQTLSVEETEEILIRLKQSDEMKNLEVLYTRKSGATFPAVVSFELIRFGADRYTIASYQDITERKRAEELLKAQNENLLGINKELESFTYISSHDLQEPLRQIRNFSSRIDVEELSDRGKMYLEKINNAANRMQTLIVDLLAYSRTKLAERNYETMDLNIILNEVREDLSEELKLKNATIETYGLGNADVIHFQFRQLLNNLVGNALKFSKPDTPPHIQITSRVEDGLTYENLAPDKPYFHIRVSDNGIGFEQQYADRIFEVFQRLHDKQKITGTGIGLAIARKIVENHNGFISATGELDKGATFDIYIPVHNS